MGPTIGTHCWWSAVVANLAERRAVGHSYHRPILDRVLHQLPEARPEHAATMGARAVGGPHQLCAGSHGWQCRGRVHFGIGCRQRRVLGADDALHYPDWHSGCADGQHVISRSDHPPVALPRALRYPHLRERGALAHDVLESLRAGGSVPGEVSCCQHRYLLAAWRQQLLGIGHRGYLGLLGVHLPYRAGRAPVRPSRDVRGCRH